MLTKQAVSFPRKEAWTGYSGKKRSYQGLILDCPLKEADLQQAEVSVAKAGQTYWLLWCHLEREKWAGETAQSLRALQFA